VIAGADVAAEVAAGVVTVGVVMAGVVSDAAGGVVALGAPLPGWLTTTDAVVEPCVPLALSV
jgi:hypothetical protein